MSSGSRKQEIPEEIQRSRNQHAQRLQTLGVLTASVAHDLNNVLTIILGHADLALVGLPKTSQRRSGIETICKAAEFATQYTRDLLEYSKEGRTNSQAVNLNKMVIESARFLVTTFTKNQIQLKHHLAGDLPEMKVNPTQLRQVLLNLLINSSEAIGNEGGVITVTTGQRESGIDHDPPRSPQTSRASEHQVYVRVSDTGCGMDEETTHQIFSPFFTTKAEGCGLGLTRVEEIVEQHHGTVVVESRPGKGTTIEVRLPCFTGARVVCAKSS